jgi:hypothetical protein
METSTMRRVLTEATIENLADLWEVEQGLRCPDAARRVTVQDAVADPHAAFLSLPIRLIRHLGLNQTGAKRVSGIPDLTDAALCDPVRLTIHGRSCTMDVMELPDDMSVVIGHIPLLHLDLVIDTRSRTLIGNPAHGGEHIYELY